MIRVNTGRHSGYFTSFRLVHYIPLVWLLSIQGCSPRTNLYQLIYQEKSTEYRIDSTRLRSIKVYTRTNQLGVKTGMGNSEKINATGVWGFQVVGGATYRLFDGIAYEVIQERTMTLYRRSNLGEGASYHYFFSIRPDTPILHLSRRNLNVAYHDQPGMQTLIRQVPVRYWLMPETAIEHFIREGRN